MIIGLLLFVLGTAVGSFVNVMIYRTVEGENWVKGRSRCDACKKKIAWYDNIPLLSFVVLGGRCRSCKKPISIQHPIIELLFGMLFGWWYLIGFTFFKLVESPLSVIQPLFWLSVGILLLIIFAADWLYQIIPDLANYALIILAFGYRLGLSAVGAMQWRDMIGALAAGVSLMGLLWFIFWVTKERGMGFGDVKFALGMGILLGWPRALIAILLAFWLGAIMGVILILSRLKGLKDKIAFGPFLVLATAVALVWGQPLWQWYWSLLL